MDETSPLVQYPPSVCDRWSQRICSIFHNITLEPVAIMASTAVALQSVTKHNLWLYKICTTNFHYSDDLCHNLTANETAQVEVQKKYSEYYLYLSFIRIIPHFFVTILMGAWCDKYGRKFPMILAKLGFFLYSLNFFVCSGFKHIPTEYLFISDCMVAITGGTHVFNTAMWSYLSDVTSQKTRTFRFGIMETALIAPLVLGLLIGGKIQETWGYLPVFGTSCVLYFLCLIYLCVFITDSLPENDNSLGQKFLDAISLSNFKESARTFFKKRPGYSRRYVLLLTLAIWMMSVPQDSSGESAFGFLFTQLKFHMNQMDFSKYTAVGVSCAFGGLVILLPILTKVLKLSDVLVALIGTIAKIINPVLVAFSPEVWMLYAASSLLVFYPFCFPSMRAQISKLVPKEEKGKIFAMTFALETVIPLFAGVLYTRLYKFSLTTFPGAIYLLSAGFIAVSAICLIYIYLHSKMFPHQEVDDALLVPRYLNENQEPEPSAHEWLNDDPNFFDQPVAASSLPSYDGYSGFKPYVRYSYPSGQAINHPKIF